MSESRGLDALREAINVSVADAEGYLKLEEAIGLAEKGYPVAAEDFLRLAGYYRRAYDLNTDLGQVFMNSVDALKRRHAQVARLEVALRKYEWGSDEPNGGSLCPDCRRPKHRGHLDGCLIGGALTPDADQKPRE